MTGARGRQTGGASGGRRPQGGGAPRTTFDKIGPPDRDLDDILLQGLPGVLLLVAAPVGMLLGGVAALVVRVVRWPWWSLLALTVAGVVWTARIGPAVVWADHTAVYGAVVDAWQHTGLVEPAAWLVASGPVSLVVAGILGAGLRLWARLRHPTYRPSVGRPASPARVGRTTSRVAAGQADPPGGVALGVTATGDVAVLSAAELSVHGLVVGGTGSGKTTAMLQLLRPLVAAGGLVYVDLKGDPDLPGQLGQVAGRPVTVWTLEGPTVWNPLGRGNATEQRDKLMTALGPYSESFYEQAARRFLQTVLAVLHHPIAGPNRPIRLTDVAGLLSVDALERRVFGTDQDSQLVADSDRLASQVRSVLADYRASRALADAVSGWRTRLATLVDADVGEWLTPTDTTTPSVDLYQTLAAGEVVCFSLDSSRYADAAAAVAKTVVRDLLTVTAQLQTRRSGRAVLAGAVVVDEFSAAAGPDLLALFARGRSAGVTTWLVTQDLADLDTADQTFRAQVIANTNVKVICRTDVSESAEALAGLAGTEQTWEETVQIATDHAHLREQRGGATGMGSLRQVDAFRIHPNELKELRRGEALLLVKHPRWRLDRLTVTPRPIPDEGAVRRVLTSASSR